MARAKRASDEVYNARRRFRRQAERYEKQAAKASGAAKSRYQALARESAQKAALTYQDTQLKGRIAGIAQRVGLTQEQVTAAAFKAGLKAGKEGLTRKQATKIVGASYKALKSFRQAEPTRDELARETLNIGNIGTRFYGGLSEIWTGNEEDRKHPDKAIMGFFGVDSIADVLEMLEDAGIDIYAPDINDDVYKSIQLKIQRLVLSIKHGKA